MVCTVAAFKIVEKVDGRTNTVPSHSANNFEFEKDRPFENQCFYGYYCSCVTNTPRFFLLFPMFFFL